MNSDFIVAVHALVYLNHKADIVSSEALAKNICTNAARVRKVMAPLKRLCEETGCTVIALRHLNKGQGAAIYRGGGSIGEGCVLRCGYHH